MTRRWPFSVAAVALLALAGCTTEDVSAGTDTGPTTSSTSSSTPSSTTPPAPPTTSSTPNTSLADLAAYICTDGIAEPDDLVLDATNAARAGTRSSGDLANAFRVAQIKAEALAARSDAAELRLTSSLLDYADVLGLVRLSLDVGLDALTQTRQAVSTSCLMSSSSTT